MKTNHTANEIGRFLEGRVQAHGINGIIFYNDLAAHFALPEVDERWQQHPLCKVFDVLDHEDARKRRPFRTVLVVSRDKNRPGQGFFNTVLMLRKPALRLTTEMEKWVFFTDELQALATHYAPRKLRQVEY